MKLDDALYAYLWENPRENNCNTYLIRGELNVLIDPGHLQFMPQLFKEMEDDGCSPEQIHLIVTTHSHPDHLEGVEAWADRPVKIAMSREEERYLSEGGKLLFDMMNKPLPQPRVDFYLKEGDLRLGQHTLEIFETPGHSPGSLSIYWPQKKALWTGDVLFFRGVGRTDFLEGNSSLLLESIERLSRLETEMLLPGHGETVVGRDRVRQNFDYLRHNFYDYL